MKAIHDKFSRIPNKQARFYFRKTEDGLCPRCGKLPSEVGHKYCSVCRKWKQEYHLRTYKPKKSLTVKGRKSKYL